jgi:preprotein translocase subunit SecD
MWRKLLPLLLIAAAPSDNLTIGGVAFPKSDFLDARAIYDETGAPVILVTFGPKGTKKLAQVTKANVGKPMSLAIGTRLLMKPVVREPILGGTIQISGIAMVEEAHQLAKQMSGKDPLPESLEE